MGKLSCKLFIALIVVLLLTYAYSILFRNQKAEYQFVGAYEYTVTNDSLVNQTYLSSESYGYLIGSPDIQGLAIMYPKTLEKESEYIISLNYPLNAAYSNSDKTRNEGMEYLKRKPLDIYQDTIIKTNKIFLYKLQEQGKYRVLGP